ncbi:AMP-binding protein [Novosphingobium album (ex Liu et al. 2023)]|uniref:AMP-binding protein n=1 Tax=Novosphingobium album (ex Liu et al. 2023) TaxID=3031130 RepID=A0ABT5WLT1_9SPHN|nr:AMP-binding protein [Novosphingobium album (ex Liu et al. 2023)]MDE8650985.1 AMP-binding protein [Novosphingobium album (ex Liu et al. 2023)]
MSNLSRFVRRHALAAPERRALSYDGGDIAYGTLWSRLTRVSGLLDAQGIAPGDRVALLMKNSAAFLEIALAVSHVGAVLVPINFRLSPAEVDFILADSGARLLFCDEEFATWEPAVPLAIRVPAEARTDASRLPGGAPREAMTPRGYDDLFRIMYTSGTTAHPKGVLHTYRNLHAKTADHIVELGLSRETRLLVAGPLYHVGAFDLPGIAVLGTGGTLCIQRDFDAGAALDLIERERLGGAWLAPVMGAELLAEQAAHPRDTSSIAWVIGGGERTPERRIREFASAFPRGRYIDAYGLTETCGGDTMMEAGREIDKIGSVGRALSQVDIEIRDDDGNALPSGEEGEVCIRGEKVTRGYWNAPGKNAASFFGTWLRTGDVGYLDADGFLFLTDRKKDLIISGGENIASSEVERAIQEHDAVLDAAVVGMANERWGERPVAFVVIRAGAETPGEDELRQHCRDRLAGFKVPDRVIFTDALPRSASGKVLKRELREELTAGNRWGPETDGE